MLDCQVRTVAGGKLLLSQYRSLAERQGHRRFLPYCDLNHGKISGFPWNSVFILPDTKSLSTVCRSIIIDAQLIAKASMLCDISGWRNHRQWQSPGFT